MFTGKLDDIRDLFTVVRSSHTDQPILGAMPLGAPVWFVDFRRADEIIPVLETRSEQNGSWLILGMHGVGADTYNNFMYAEEHRRLVDWIAAQGNWLEAVTVHEAEACWGLSS